MQANGESRGPTISADGRYVAFTSVASNLVAGDTNGLRDVFRHDRVTGSTTRVSVTTDGLQADGDSRSAAISGNGEVVAFTSDAANLYFLGNGGTSQIYAHDTVTGGTSLCSRLVFTPGDDASSVPDISHDGSRIVFRSLATNLAGGGDPATSDIFLFDGGTVSIVSRGVNGTDADDDSHAPVISGDGSSVAFESSASNLIPNGTLFRQVFLYDIAGDITTIVSATTSGDHGQSQSSHPSISFDGKRVAFQSGASNLVPGDTNGQPDVFVRDVTTRTTVCLTRLPDGQQGRGEHPALAPGGEHIAFDTPANGIDVYVRHYGVRSRNAGSNPESYVASRPVLGEEWRASVDLSTTGHSLAVIHGKIGSLDVPLGGGQRLLIGGQSIFKLPARSGPIAGWAATLPSDPGLAGRQLFTQAVHVLGVTPFALSNAQDLCMTY